MKVFSQLEKAQLENTTSDTGSLPKGMITYRTDLNIAKVSNGTSMLALIDESSTQTLSGKTYASPVTTGAIQGAQIATPANPSAGNNKLYFKSDGKLYTLDSSGNEAAVGSGTGGVKNLITNGNADDTASSIFVPYADTGIRPVDGTGGSPTVTTSITTTTPLDGVKSFLLTKPASNVQGQGWAVPFTVDPAYRAKSLKISVDYIVNSGTFVAGGAGVESDVIWYIYDVTNSQLIEPSNIKMFSNNSSISDKFEATFQSSATGSSYRLIAHVQSVSALAYELKVDNITVSPQSYVFGTPVTDLINTFTPTIGGLGTGGVSAASIKWGRHGDMLVGRLTWTKDGSAGSGVSTVTMTLPFTVDSTKVNGTGDVVGNGYSSNGTVFQARLNGVYNQINLIRADTSATLTGSDVGAGRSYYIDLIFPVSGWSSSVQTSDNADTRVVAARYSTDAGVAVPSLVSTLIDFEDKTLDTHNAVTTGGGWKFTAPVSGIYEVSCAWNYATSTYGGTSNFQAYLLKNGSQYCKLGFVRTENGSGSIAPAGFGSTLISLNAGDYIHVVQFQDNGATENLEASGVNNYIDIKRLSGPAAIAASESVSAKFRTSAGQSIPITTGAIVDFGTKDWDSHGAVTTGVSWKFTAPIAGEYQINVSNRWDGSFTANNVVFQRLYKNGVAGDVISLVTIPITGSTNNLTMNGSVKVKLLAGDYVQVYAVHQEGVAKTLFANSVSNWIEINRIGSY